MAVSELSRISSSPGGEILTSAQAQFLLRDKLDLQLVPVESADIQRIAARDKSINYSGFHEYGFKLTELAIVSNGMEIGFAASKVGTKWNESVVMGEVRGISITPSLRGVGLGTLVNCIARLKLIEDGALLLRSHVADTTGIIDQLNTDLGYKESGKKLDDGSPEWFLRLGNQQHIQKTQVLLSNKFRDRLSTSQKENLRFDPNEVDRDNPTRKPIIETVRASLGTDLLVCADADEIYGYDGAPVKIYQQHFKISGDRCLVLRVLGENVNLQAAEGLNCHPYPTTLIVNGYEFESDYVKSPAELSPWLERFALMGQDMVSKPALVTSS